MRVIRTYKLVLHAMCITLLLLPVVSWGQTSWTGAVSSSWGTAANWTAGVPDQATDAVIGDNNFTGSYQPVISYHAACRSLTLGAGTGAPVLNVNKSFTIAGNLVINAGASMAQKGVTLTVNGNWSNSGSYTTSNQNAKVNLGGVGQTIGGSVVTSFRKLAIGVGSTVTLNSSITVTNTLTVNGTLVPAENASPYSVLGSPSISVSASGILAVTASSFDANYTYNSMVLSAGSTVDYSATQTSQTIKAALSYSTLRISGSGVKTLGGNLSVLNSSTAAAGRIDVTAGTLDLSAYTANRGNTVAGGSLSVANGATLKIGGTNSFPSGYATHSLSLTSTVEYNGTAQSITAETYGNLVLSGASGTVTKSMPVTDFTVSGNLSSATGSATAVSFTAASNITVGGSVNIGTATTFNGGTFTHNIAGNWVNNGTFTGNASTVNITNGGSAISGTGAHNFYNLNFSATNITAAANSNLVISGNLSTAGPGSFTHLSGGTLSMTGVSKSITGTGIVLSSLTIAGSVSCATMVSVTGNFTVNSGSSFTGTGGTVELSGAGKSIAGTGTINFGTLSVSGTITTTSDFTVGNTLQVTGSFTATAGTATFTGSSVLGGVANLFNVTLNGSSLQLSSNTTLGIAGVYTVTAGVLNATSTTPNTVNFNGAGAQNVPGGTYDNLIFSNSGTKSATGAVAVNSTLTISSGVTFSAASYTHSIGGNWVNSGSFTAGTSTIAFTGTASSTISGSTTFNILTVNKATTVAQVSLLNDVSAPTVNMTNGMMNTGSSTLTITSTRTGNGVILGTIRRSHSFGTNVAYAFESPNNTITFTGIATLATSITVKVEIGPVSDFPKGGSVNRVYTISSNSALDLASITLRLHYEDAELNGNVESSMGLWKNAGLGWVTSGKTSNNTTSNYVEQTSLLGVEGRWTLSDNGNVIRWNGSVSSDWSTPGNWTATQGTPSSPPGPADIVEIGTVAFTNQPVIAAGVNIKGISLGSAQAVNLSVTTGGALTVQGNITGTWAANVTHTINANNQPVTVNGDLVLSDGTSGHAINLNMAGGTVTVAGSLTQSGGAAISCSGTGTLIIGGNFNYSSGTFTAGNGTVNYNGAASQTVAGVNYNHLTINKTGGAAVANNTLTVGGNLSVTAGELDLNAGLTLTGDLNTAAGTLVKAGAANISLQGNWNNSGSFVPGTSTVVFAGSASQAVSATTFNNLTINKAAGTVTLTGNLVLNGNLAVTAGTLSLAAYTANRGAAGGTLSLSNGAMLQVGAAAGFPSNYSTYTLGSSSTVVYNGTITQTVAGVNYGHLSFSNSSTKTLAGTCTVNGDITINSGATLNAAGFTVNLYGNWVNNGSFTPATGTVTLNGASKTITGNTTFNRLTIYGSYTVNGSDITYNGLLLIATGGSYNAGSGSATVNGDLTNNGSLVSNGVTTFTGTSQQTIRFVNAVTSNSSGVINFNGTVSPVLNSTSTPTYATLNINNTAGVNASVGWLVMVAFNISSGATFNGGASTHTIRGSFTNNGTVTSSGTLYFNPYATQNIQLVGTGFSSTGTVIFGGTAPLTVSGTPTAFNNVIIANTVGVTPAANWNIGGDFQVGSNAVFNAGSYSYTVAGDIESNGTLNGGTSGFTMTNTAGNLNGSATTTFYDFTVTGNTTVGADFNIAHNFTNNGTIDATVGGVNITGSQASLITGSAASFNLAQLHIDKTNNAVVTMAKSLTGITDLQIVNGTLDAATYTLTQDAAGGTLTIDDSARLLIRGTNSLPVFGTYLLDTLSTVEYAGSTQTIATTTAYGNLTISAAGTKTAGAILNILNDFTLSDGSFVPGSFADTVRGNWNMTGGTFTNTGNTIVFAGTGTQTVYTVGAFNNVTINKTAGLVSLSSSSTMNGTLNFLSGKIKTGSNKVILPAGATVTNAGQGSGWVYGLLQKNVATGTGVNRSFEIGDSLSYTPVTVVLASVTTSGNLVAGNTATDHPALATSGMNSSKSVNRYWTLTNAGVVFTTATVTLNWVTGDVDAGANTTNFKVAAYNGSSWTLATVSSPLATSIQANGLSSLGDLAVAELLTINTWTGAVSSNWHTTGNWSAGFVPGNTTDVVIPAALVTYPVISAGTAATKALTIQTGATVTVNGVLLQIAGNLTNTGTLTAGNGSIEFNGTAAQTIPNAAFTGNLVKNLTINNTAGVTLAGALQVAAVLKVTAGQLNTGGYLTLLSTATQTALIDGSGAGEVLGNVTMQRYLPSAFGYKYLSSPFQAATVNELADDINLSASFPALYRYEENQASSGWVRYTGTTGLLVPLQGYAANMGTAATPKTVTMTGVVNNHNVSATLYNYNKTFTLGFNLAGNPYPSPIDWDAAAGWNRSNIDNAVYYFNASASDQYTGVYSSYINGISSDGVAGNVIAAMQGFFVHVSDGSFPVTGTLTVNNNARINNTSPVFHREGNRGDDPLLRMSAGFAGEPLGPDALVVYLDAAASAAFDKDWDALKLMNTTAQVPSVYTVSSDAAKLSINAIPAPGEKSVVPVGIKIEKAGLVQFRASEIKGLPRDMFVYLRDEVTGQLQDLLQNPAYSLQLDAGKYENRLSLVFSRTNLLHPAPGGSLVTLPPVTVRPGNTMFKAYTQGARIVAAYRLPAGEKASLFVTNMLGQVIWKQDISGSGQQQVNTNLSTGVYIVSFCHGKNIDSQKLFVGN